MPGSVEDQFAEVLATTDRLLKSLGYSKRGLAFRKRFGSNVTIIGFQRSMTNDRWNLRFTVNAAVISAALLDGDRDIWRVSGIEGQLQARIGQFLDDPTDKWWTLTEGGEAGSAAAEIAHLLRDKVVPYLERHSSDAALGALWETGRSPGLTEVQRRRFLSRLKGGG